MLESCLDRPCLVLEYLRPDIFIQINLLSRQECLRFIGNKCQQLLFFQLTYLASFFYCLSDPLRPSKLPFLTYCRLTSFSGTCSP